MEWEVRRFMHGGSGSWRRAGRSASRWWRRQAFARNVESRKLADHLPLHRQAKMFRRHGVEIAVQTLCGWMAQSGELLYPLYGRLKQFVLDSGVVGTDDAPVKVLDRKLPQARKGRIWPYVGDRDHFAVVYD
jgi:transposase